MRKNHKNFQSSSIENNYKKELTVDDQTCFNRGKTGHFIADCNRPEKDEKKSFEKKRSEEEMRSFIKKREQKVLGFEESKRKWADPDSKTSNSENSSSESDNEPVQCLMANAELKTT